MTTAAPTSARSGGYARGRATREEILDVAMQLFGEVGYRTASLREVASRVGISHPGLLHHFASKAVRYPTSPNSCIATSRISSRVARPLA